MNDCQCMTRKKLVEELRDMAGRDFRVGLTVPSVLVKLLLQAATQIEQLEQELEHSEWLRQRQGQTYGRVGDEIV